MFPEEKARIEIDKKLRQSGWIVQDMREFNPAQALGVVVRSYPTDTGNADYIMFVDKKPVGVIEAKESNQGERITVAEEQTWRYATSKLKWTIDSTPLRFAYESTDIITRFTDYKDEKARSRQVFSFHTPETIYEWLKDKDTLRNNLKKFPKLNEEGLRECQVRAITNLEKSFSQNKPRALIQMTTGAGKTYTAITSVYRLLKHANAKRILFLVDTKNLGEQAEQEFMGYTPNDDPRRFVELYNLKRLNSSYIPKDSHVCISTIQRMYSILKGQELDEKDEETSLNEINQPDTPRDVVYNEKYPPEFFDFIIIDECHRSIYNLWKQVLDYFDAFLIGLTATPDKRTFAFFNENIVSEYTHEQAVADGVNVGYDIYLIETDITNKGGYLPARQYIDRRNRLTREKRWQQLDEDVTYSASQLDKDVVNPSQIRNVIKTFKDKLLTEIFPERKEVPKTLIFAKTDSHADDIIQIVRDEFCESNQFCKKITYNSKEDPKSVLASFRNDYNPRIAVTVDMIATGTDVKAIECLLFMRNVKSKSYFEQMKGRGTRTINKSDFLRLNSSATENKTHFIIIDAVGVCKSVKTDSRALERKPHVPMNDLLLNVVNGSRDEDTVTSLANRLMRLHKKINDDEKAKFKELARGKSMSETVKDLLDSFDPDVIEKKAVEKYTLTIDEVPTEYQLKEACKELAEEAVKIFYSWELREFIENARKNYEQIIDTINIDTVVNVGWDGQHKEKAAEAIQTFRDFIEANKNEITALQIFYNQAYKHRAVTLKMVKELYEAMNGPPYNLTNERLWNAYYIQMPEKVKNISAQRMLTDIVSLLRFELKIDDEILPYADIVNRNFKKWVFKKNAGHRQFTEEQMEWLRMIKDHVITSMCIDKESFEYSPFDSKGGLGKLYQLFGDEYERLLEEINLELVA